MQRTNNPVKAFLLSDYYRSRVLAPEIRHSERVSAALAIVRGRWPDASQNSTDTESPVFLLSAGWGSGSTLLQRLITSASGVLIWGEPHDHAIPVHRLAQMLAPISDKWPKDSYFNSGDKSKPLHEQWIANYSPPIAALRRAHRSFIEAWLKESAMALGYDQWGLKDVRLTIDHARYLRWLFPDSKFVFIYRDVLSSYRSCKNVRWFSVWPDYRVSPPAAFAHHWMHLLSGFIAGAKDVDGLLIKYEDLVSGALPVSKIAKHLGLDTIDDTLLHDKIGARGSSNKSVSPLEKYIIQSITGDLRKAVNYD